MQVRVLGYARQQPHRHGVPQRVLLSPGQQRCLPLWRVCWCARKVRHARVDSVPDIVLDWRGGGASLEGLVLGALRACVGCENVLNMTNDFYVGGADTSRNLRRKCEPPIQYHVFCWSCTGNDVPSLPASPMLESNGFSSASLPLECTYENQCAAHQRTNKIPLIIVLSSFRKLGCYIG